MEITDSGGLMQQESSGEVVDMCTALEQLVESGRREKTKDLIVDWTQEGYSVGEIAKLLKATEEFVRKIQEESGVVV